MKEEKIETFFKVYETLRQLPDTIHAVMLQAIEIRKKAYAPYSGFKVGAALLLDNGQIILGTNQENAAYPSGLCAERTAVFSAAVNYPEAKIIALAITATADKVLNTEPVAPCGACRQSLLEYEVKQQQPFNIYFMGGTGRIVEAPSVKSLLPFAFESFES